MEKTVRLKVISLNEYYDETPVTFQNGAIVISGNTELIVDVAPIIIPIVAGVCAVAIAVVAVLLIKKNKKAKAKEGGNE
mgnify:CR=1 FL=1